MPLIRTLLLGVLGLLASPALAERQLLDRDLAMKQANGPEVEQAHAVADRLEKQSDSEGLAAFAMGIATDPVLPPAGRDKLLADAARRLASMPDRAGSRQFLETLAVRESEVLVPVEETRGLVHIPLYDAAAQARHSLRTLDIRAVAESLEPRVTIGDTALSMEALAAAPGSLFRQGLVKALFAAPAASRAPISFSLASLVSQDPSLGELALAARGPADTEILATVLVRGDAPSALQALALTRSLSAPEARPLLEAALDRGDLASAAILEAGRRWPEDPATGRWLEALLGDPAVGASAAAALARYGDESLVARMAERLSREADERAARHLVLYLRLADSPAARDAMGRLRGDPGISAAVRRELR